MGFAFAFGGVYLNAQSGSKAEAKPEQTAEDPVVLLQRALLNDSAAEERLRRLLVEVENVDAPPTQADAPDRHNSYADAAKSRS